MSLADRIRTLRTQAGLSLEELAAKARLSKTYLWELEKDEAGVKKPSADVLLRLATALSTTIADLMSLPSVRVEQDQIQISPSLEEFQKRMEGMGSPLSPEDLRDLATMKFRGGQPQTADEWHSLYLVFAKTSRRRKS
jgi:transcriptional regulator with XRE-family HTH domain